MSENLANNKNVKDDEIDLLDLLRRMGKTLNRWTNTLGKLFLISIVFLLKRWIPLGLSILAGIGISYLIKSTSISSFTSDMIFRNNLALVDKRAMRDNSGTTAELIDKINKLNTLCATGNSQALSEALFLKPELGRNISEINSYWIIDQNRDGIPDYVDYKGNHSVYDTINIRMQDRMDIRVRINSPQDLNLVRNGIIRYIESDSLFQQRNRLRLKQNNDLLKHLDRDILQLDSLQKVKYFEETRNMKPANGGQIIFMQEQKTQLVYNDIYALYTRKQLLESERDLYAGVVTVLSDFSSPTRRENGVMYYGKQIIPTFFALTLLILILLANRKKFKDIYQKYQ